VHSLAGSTGKALSRQGPNIHVRNRFSSLECEDLDHTEDTNTNQTDQHACTEGHISSVRAKESGVHDLLVVEGKINGIKATMLIDSGSTHDLIATRFVKRHGLGVLTRTEPFRVTLADGRTCEPPSSSTDEVKVVVGDFSERQTFSVFPVERYDVILGKPWLFRNNPAIDLTTTTTTQNCPGRQQASEPGEPAA